MNRYKRMNSRRIPRFEYCGDYFKDGKEYFAVWHNYEFGDVYYTVCALNPQ